MKTARRLPATALYALLTATAIAPGCRAAPTPAATPDRPNIVVIMTDDLGYADVGFNGSPDIRTPHLDELAAHGVVMTSAYVAHPFCGPSRMGFISGRNPHLLGTPYNLPESKDGESDQGVPVEETTMGTMLQQAGYRTGLIGKWHMGATAEHHPNQRGFDDFYGFLPGGHSYFPEEFNAKWDQAKKTGNLKIWDYLLPLEHNGEEVRETEYVTDGLTREGVRFIAESAGKENPFFLFMSYNAPHTPLEALQEDMDQFPDIKDKDRKTYAGMVWSVDRGVGKLVDALKAADAFDNTLIIFLSDNGGRPDQGANNAPLKQGKGHALEGGWRVPMFFHWPAKLTAGQTYDYPVTTLDFYPTFASLAQAEIPTSKKLDGVDVSDGVASGTDARPGELVYTVVHRNGYSDYGVRRDSLKAVKLGNKDWALYDVDADPGENKDLSGQHGEELKQIVSQMGPITKEFVQPLFFHAKEAEDKWKETHMPHHDKVFK